MLKQILLLYRDNKYTETIQETEKVAKEKEIGIWSNSTSIKTTDDKD